MRSIGVEREVKAKDSIEGGGFEEEEGEELRKGLKEAWFSHSSLEINAFVSVFLNEWRERRRRSANLGKEFWGRLGVGRREKNQS